MNLWDVHWPEVCAHAQTTVTLTVVNNKVLKEKGEICVPCETAAGTMTHDKS